MYEGERAFRMFSIWGGQLQLAMKIASPQIHASKSVALPSPTGHYLELSRVPALLSVRTKDTEIILQYLILV